METDVDHLKEIPLAKYDWNIVVLCPSEYPPDAWPSSNVQVCYNSLCFDAAANALQLFFAPLGIPVSAKTQT